MAQHDREWRGWFRPEHDLRIQRHVANLSRAEEIDGRRDIRKNECAALIGKALCESRSKRHDREAEWLARLGRDDGSADCGTAGRSLSYREAGRRQQKSDTGESPQKRIRAPERHACEQDHLQIRCSIA